jgi:hypothetical protein
MLPIINADPKLDTSILTLLERYSLEDIVAVLHDYTQVQGKLALVIEQNQAATKWNCQAEALNTACEQLDEMCDEELYYLIY